MLIRIVRMSFRTEAVAEFEEIFRQSEAAIRSMPGCLHLELWRDVDNPAIFCTHSHWESAAALEAYRKSAVFGQVWPKTKRLFAAPPLAFSVQPALVPQPAAPTSR